MSSEIGTIQVEIVADSSKFEVGVKKATEAAKKATDEAKAGGEEAARSYDKAAAAAKRFETSVIRQAQAIGKSKADILEAKAASLGLSQSLEPYIRKLREAEKAQGNLNDSTTMFSRLAGVAFAAVSAQAIFSQFKGAIDAADNLNDLSQKIGVSVEDLSGLRLVAEQSGTSLEAVGSAMGKLSKYMVANATAMKDAGITATDAKGALIQLADQFAAMEDGPVKTALAMQMMGKAGADMIPLLNMGGATMEEMIERGKRLAPVTAEMAAQADLFNDQLAIMAANQKGISIQIANALLPTLNEMAKAFIESNDGAGAMAATSKALVTVLQTVAVLGANVAYVFRGIGTELGGMAAQIVALGSGDFKAFSAIGNAMKEDAAKARKDIDALSERLLNPVTPEAVAKIKQKGRQGIESLIKDESAKTKKEKTDTGFADYEVELTQKIANAINSTDIIKAQQLTAELRKLEELAAAGLDPELVKSVRNDLTGATKQAADEAARLNSLIAATPSAQLEKVRDDMMMLADALTKGTITAEQFNEAAIARSGKIGDDVKETTNYVEELGMTFTSAFEDAIVGGKELSDVLKGLEQDIIRIITRKLVTEPLADMATGFLKEQDWGSMISSFMASANGNVFPAGPGISAYSGQIVSQPTLFPFANGVGLMGEAGAEAIMPLKRGADGKLGVQASGGATTINNNFHITGAADPRTQAQIAQQAGAAAARAMRRNG